MEEQYRQNFVEPIFVLHPFKILLDCHLPLSKMAVVAEKKFFQWLFFFFLCQEGHQFNF